MSKETRSLSEVLEARSSEDGLTIHGYGLVYDQETVIAGLFREVIRPGAARAALSNKLDMLSAFNHSPDYVLGRKSNGTLQVTEDDRGVSYKVLINPADAQAVSVHAKVSRGDVVGSSFSFEVAEGGDRMVRGAKPGELPLREILQLKAIHEIGPVTFPAYESTSVSARCIEEAKRPSVDTLSRERSRWTLAAKG